MTIALLKEIVGGLEGETLALSELPTTSMDSAAWRAFLEGDLGVAPVSPGIYDVLSVKLALRKPQSRRQEAVDDIQLGPARFAHYPCPCGATSWIQVLKVASCPKCGKRAKTIPRRTLRWDTKSGTFLEETNT